MADRTRFIIDEEFRERLAEAGLLDFEAVMARQDFEAVKTKLAARHVHRMELGDGSLVYLKRYFSIPFLEALRDRLGGRGYDSGVSRERLALERLRELGIPAARVLAAAERSSLGLVRQGFLVTQALPVTRSLESLVAAGEEGPEPVVIRTVVAHLAALVRKMHEGGVNHRDLYLGHLMIGDAFPPVHVMDLNRADCRRIVPRRWRVKDLAALDVSTPDRLVGTRQRLRFLRLYLGESLREHRDLVGAIRRKAAVMRRHIERKIERGAPNFHLNR